MAHLRFKAATDRSELIGSVVDFVAPTLLAAWFLMVVAGALGTSLAYWQALPISAAIGGLIEVAQWMCRRLRGRGRGGDRG